MLDVRTRDDFILQTINHFDSLLRCETALSISETSKDAHLSYMKIKVSTGDRRIELARQLVRPCPI